MKKIFVLVATALITHTALITPVLASPPAGGPIAPGQIWKSVREDVKKEQQDVKKDVVEEVKGAKGEIRSDVAQIHATRLKQRFLGIYYPKLNAFIQKLQAKIDSMTAAGKNTAASQAKLDEAKATLTAAKTLADQSIAGFEAIEPAKYNVQRQQAIEASNQAKDARAKFVQTIKLLKDTIQLMKAA